ncbi:hypothetical protein IVB38_38115 [Bradyrhizobium sp. 38]|uniref:hypothetical protein n=1 Tax=unclassified Bradyrhizobium TaxID=2631580 RepID=UPI001FF74985|nr:MULTISPECIES: hypothetical protein [unclassified Bradyrhizobium]MCK1341645.1 hypothetical protein [Bradyrhizobium sp. 38]MCK1778824.1 hypothetical protein [Bradyrhizobium sp. 132]
MPQASLGTLGKTLLNQINQTYLSLPRLDDELVTQAAAASIRISHLQLQRMQREGLLVILNHPI